MLPSIIGFLRRQLCRKTSRSISFASADYSFFRDQPLEEAQNVWTIQGIARPPRRIAMVRPNPALPLYVSLTCSLGKLHGDCLLRKRGDNGNGFVSSITS